MSDHEMTPFATAVSEFRRLRRRAALEQALARFTGHTLDLVPFDEARQAVKATAIGGGRQLEEIPLDAIVGSVGRYGDFSRSFLPLQDSDAERWARVMLAAEQGTGLPPIEVYQIGEAYFVSDGNHRISVARMHGATSIQAYVTRFATRVPISKDLTPDQLIIRAEYAEFLEQTALDLQRPGCNLLLSAPGKYAVLLEHIHVHRYFLDREQQTALTFPAAAASWYDTVYLPVVETIRARGLLRDFPERSEADLYVWLAENRAALAVQLGWDITNTTVIRAIRARPEAPLEAVLNTVAPDSGPLPGRWREELAAVGRDQRLFRDFLVPVSDGPHAWDAFEQSLSLAKLDNGRLYGLHVVADPAQRERPEVLALRAEFIRRCEAAGVPGSLAIEVGPVGRAIAERTRWVDLLILRVSYPPDPSPVARLKSGLRTIIRRSVRPVLALASAPKPIGRALLAYDASPRAQEALFVATYLAARFALPLDVLSIDEDGNNASRALGLAREALSRCEVTATYHQASGAVSSTILATAAACQSDLVIMGGYGKDPVTDLFLGSAVEDLLRAAKLPILICQ